jgi:hypothetical protein
MMRGWWCVVPFQILQKTTKEWRREKRIDCLVMLLVLVLVDGTGTSKQSGKGTCSRMFFVTKSDWRLLCACISGSRTVAAHREHWVVEREVRR